MSPDAGFAVVAAVDDEGGIGRGGGLPWRLRADMEHFRRLTTGPGGGANAVILGRRTWESLPPRFRPLPERRNVVITGRAEYAAPGAQLARGFEEALRRAGAGGGEVFVIGGAEVYAAALAHPRCGPLWITRVAGAHGCDARFPRFAELRLVRAGEELAEGALRYRFCEYAAPGR